MSKGPEQVAVAPAPGDTYYERLAAPVIPQQGPGESMAQREARRLHARLGEDYVPESGADVLGFNPMIAFKLALGMGKPSDIFSDYGIALDEARRLIADPVFIGTIKKYKEDVAANGLGFKMKCRIQAEDLLTHSYLIATDPEAPAAVRADLIKWTGKMAGYEPDTKGEKGAGGGATFALNITFAGDRAPPQGRVIDSTATLVEG